ncbi:MAG: 2OG-Fe(II) oxygenase [Defluviicoccus sp.]|nr:MAG: 2OG-Fe(II) oxygenase [Defluviicoccus sp.]
MQARFGRRMRRLLRGRSWRGEDGLSARFDFSIMPADGGLLLPHTDNPEKIITLVISMVRPGEWSPDLGGGLDINRPRSPELAFNHLNRKAGFADMDILHTFEFAPNQGILFVKTFNSWHSVRPMTATGSTALRRTLTINIEKRN